MHRSARIIAQLLTTTAVASMMPGLAHAQTSSASPTTDTPAAAQPASQANDDGLSDIIVTAQKRSQSINKVPITIIAQSEAQLAARGVVDTADLAKVVPGFVFTPSPYGSQVFTLRGVGLYDSGFASSPAVSVYVDEVPLPYPIMSPGATLDLERVEVLKGPQGTLFGQNNTGGAINYIAAKPTKDFHAGGHISYARFGRVDASGYITGALTSTLDFRLSARSVQGGAWQISRTRPNDRLGNADQLFGRLLLNWTPTDRLKIGINVNGWRDRSDTQAAQLQSINSDIAGNPLRVQYPEFLNQPVAYKNARSADWTPDAPNKANDGFWQASVRADYDLTDDIVLTSVSAYSDMRPDRFVDMDATAVADLDSHSWGRLKDFNQELRISGKTSAVTWLLGANYEHTHSIENQEFNYPFNSLGKPDLALAPGGIGIPPYDKVKAVVDQTISNKAIFGNLEYEITQHLTAQVSGRYTWSDRQGTSCELDTSALGSLNQFFEALQGALKGPGNVIPLQRGDCVSLDSNFNPGAYHQTLNEKNFSYHAAINYKLDNGALLYASYSRGYKSGVISNISGATQKQFQGVPQERVDAYEAGIKLPLFDRRVQFNAAAFLYDYKDKQVRARVFDPIFGLVESLVTVPKSRITGVEADLQAEPFKGLNLSVAATYVDSRVKGDFTSSNGTAVYNQGGQTGNFRDSPLSYTPRFTLSADAQYEWSLSSDLKALVGASTVYHSRDNASLEVDKTPDPDYVIRAYTTLDLRAGIAASDDKWNVQLFGRNVTNAYYWTTVFQGLDERHRYAAMPATYGISISFKL